MSDIDNVPKFDTTTGRPLSDDERAALAAAAQAEAGKATSHTLLVMTETTTPAALTAEQLEADIARLEAETVASLASMGLKVEPASAATDAEMEAAEDAEGAALQIKLSWAERKAANRLKHAQLRASQGTQSKDDVAAERAHAADLTLSKGATAKMLQEAAAEHVDTALAVLVGLLGSRQGAVALKAVELLLERAAGKSASFVHLEGRLDGLTSIEQLDAVISAAARGEVSVEDAKQLSALISARHSASAESEIIARLAALEAAMLANPDAGTNPSSVPAPGTKSATVSPLTIVRSPSKPAKS